MKNNSILLYILLFAFFTRIYNLGFPQKEYFDEVYHVFTAQKITANDNKAWEWWNTAPEGYAFEWTHPPVAKLIMAVFMKFFGQHPIIWRLPSVLLSLGVIYLTYLIAALLFSQHVGLLAAAILALDGLLLTLSRIGMNDMYMLFFALLSLYAFLRNWILISSLCFGLAIASKWSAIWFMPLFALIYFVMKKRVHISYILFMLVPPIVYVGSYFPLFLTGHDWEHFVLLQKQMWWYHTGLNATHPYSSVAWQWPLLIRPIYLFTTQDNEWPSRIYAMGNPIIFWVGLYCSIIASLYLIFQKKVNLAIISFAYFSLWVPWIFSPRILFLYHYLPALPFLSIIIAFCLEKNKLYIYFFLICVFLSFIYFYPHWVAITISNRLDNSYYWFSTWR